MPQCTANSSQSGQRCRKEAIKGATVCRNHGGSAPQVRAKAAQRLLEAADPAAAYLVSLVRDKSAAHNDRKGAAIAILDRAGLSVKQVIEHSGPDGGAIETSIRVEYIEGALNGPPTPSDALQQSEDL